MHSSFMFSHHSRFDAASERSKEPGSSYLEATPRLGRASLDCASGPSKLGFNPGVARIIPRQRALEDVCAKASSVWP